MTRRTLLAATVLLTALTLPAQERSQERGAWHAASKSAKSITSDVAFAENKITIAFLTFPAAQIRTLTPSEIGAAFDADTANPAGRGNLYRISIPASRKFLHNNSLCGSDDAQWVATYVLGKTLQLAIFSGSQIPTLTPEAIATGTDLCGTFTYTR
jgi:hypothetical protein